MVQSAVLRLRVLSWGLFACAAAIGLSAQGAQAGDLPADMPPQAVDGEAWCRTWVPASYETRSERVMVAPGRTIKRWIPPVYGTRMKLVCVQEAKLRHDETPPTFVNRTRTVTTSPERSVWRKLPCDTCGCNPQECWKKETCPATMEEICEQVCQEAGAIRLHFTPAQYRLVPEKYEITPARCEEVQIPPRFEMRSKRVCTCKGKWKWTRRPVARRLAALQVELDDQSADGTEKGVFEHGELVRYTVRLTHDQGSMAMTNLRVVFALPPELEFVRASVPDASGGAITIKGSAQAAASDVFALNIGEVRTIHVLARVIGVPESHLVQFGTRVEAATGELLAVETESTTLRRGRRSEAAVGASAERAPAGGAPAATAESQPDAG